MLLLDFFHLIARIKFFVRVSLEDCQRQPDHKIFLFFLVAVCKGLYTRIENFFYILVICLTYNTAEYLSTYLVALSVKELDSKSGGYHSCCKI